MTHFDHTFDEDPRQPEQEFRPADHDPIRQEAQEPAQAAAPDHRAEEPRTPYQTPVRAQAGQAQEPQGTFDAPQAGAYEAGAAGRTTYEEWAAQEKKHQAKQARTKGKRRIGRKPLLIVGGIAAVCALFAGGIALGSAMYKEEDGAAQTIVADPNLPSVNIANTPSGSGSANADGTLSGTAIYEKVSPSVVSVQAVSMAEGTAGTGSGVIMSADGYIITNNHVVVSEQTGAEANKVTVILSDGTNLPAEIVGRDAQTDLAVLKVQADDSLTPAEFGDSTALRPGEDVYAIGSPGGVELANTITGGRISAINRDITISDRVMSLIQTDAAINPGNSGGALINAYGQVIGITSAKIGGEDYEGLGFAIPMDTAKEIVDQLIQYGYIVGRPQIGISGQNLSEREAEAYDVPQGVLIARIDSRSNAAQAGVRVNDIIIGINGKDITTMDEINEVKDDLKAGDQITLKLYRVSTGKTLTASFALNDQHDLEGEDPAESQQQDTTDNSFGGYRYYNPFQYFFGW